LIEDEQGSAARADVDRDRQLVPRRIGEMDVPVWIKPPGCRILSPDAERLEQLLGFVAGERHPRTSQRAARAAIGRSVIDLGHVADPAKPVGDRLELASQSIEQE
jgi:hypothetical protein